MIDPRIAKFCNIAAAMKNKMFDFEIPVSDTSFHQIHFFRIFIFGLIFFQLFYSLIIFAPVFGMFLCFHLLIKSISSDVEPHVTTSSFSLRKSPEIFNLRIRIESFNTN